MAIVTAIIAFAYSLHLKAVAEGVEKTLPSFNSEPSRAASAGLLLQPAHGSRKFPAGVSATLNRPLRVAAEP